MEPLKIGQIAQLGSSTIICVEDNFNDIFCCNCFFDDKCCWNMGKKFACKAREREDGKSVHFEFYKHNHQQPLSLDLAEKTINKFIK